jgi:hypothetical protein
MPAIIKPIIKMSSRHIKCASVKQYANGNIKECNSAGRVEYDWFCSMEHQSDAKKYAGEATYNTHCNRVQTVLKNKALYQSFNAQIRPAFASIIMARKQKEEAEFLMSAGMEYAMTANEAWSETQNTLNNAQADELKALTDAVTKTQQNVKKRQTDTIDLSKLNTSESPTKKAKAQQFTPLPTRATAQRTTKTSQRSIASTSTATNPLEIPITAELLRQSEEMLHKAVNEPLPDDDDDLQDDNAPMSV